MKLRAEFVIREVMDSIVAIPVGQTALELNGMILLNAVSKVIWDHLVEGTELEEVVKALTDAFEVSPEEARADTLEFVDKLRRMRLLDE